MEEKLIEKEKWILKKKSKDQERVIGEEEMAHWFRVNTVLPRLIPRSHVVWLTVACHSSFRRSDVSGFHRPGTHIYTPIHRTTHIHII